MHTLLIHYWKKKLLSNGGIHFTHRYSANLERSAKKGGLLLFCAGSHVVIVAVQVLNETLGHQA